MALIAVLEALDPQLPDAPPAGAAPRRQLICIANTHIHANPELNDVKLWQVIVHTWYSWEINVEQPTQLHSADKNIPGAVRRAGREAGFIWTDCISIEFSMGGCRTLGRRQWRDGGRCTRW